MLECPTHTNEPTSGRFDGTSSWSVAPNTDFSLAFIGSQVRIFSVFAPNHGVVALSIDRVQVIP